MPRSCRGMMSRQDSSEILPCGQTGDLRVGSKGHIPSNFLESVGICDGPPLTVDSNYLFSPSNTL